jgi:hypothetical protein
MTGAFATPASWCRCAPLRVVLSAVLLLGVASTAEAQRERAVVRVESFGGTTVSAPTGTRSPDDMTQRSLQLQLSHRLVRDGGQTILFGGAQYRGTRLALPTRPTAGTDDGTVDLVVAGAELGLVRRLDPRHTLVSVLRPSAFGTSADAGQLRVEGAVFVDRILSARTVVGAGMSYASNFGRVLPIPVLHVVTQPSATVRIDALLPSRADLWWMPRKGLDLGIGAALTGAQYGLPDNLQVVTGADALWLANATVGPQLRWTPGNAKWQLTADAGSTVLRRLRYARGGDELADLAPGNVWFGRAGLLWLF